MFHDDFFYYYSIWIRPSFVCQYNKKIFSISIFDIFILTIDSMHLYSSHPKSIFRKFYTSPPQIQYLSKNFYLISTRHATLDFYCVSDTMNHLQLRSIWGAEHAYYIRYGNMQLIWRTRTGPRSGNYRLFRGESALASVCSLHSSMGSCCWGRLDCRHFWPNLRIVFDRVIVSCMQ